MIDRRLLLAGLGGGAAVGLGAQGANAAAAAASPSTPAPAPRPDFGFLRTEALVNAERAQAVMAREGIDAFVVAQPTNVFYLANHWPNLDRMGFRHSMFVIYPRDRKRPVAMVMTGFLHYYRFADDVELPNHMVFPYTTPAEAATPVAGGAGAPEPTAAPTRMHRILDATLLTPREEHRRSVSTAAEPESATADWALFKALRHLGLEKARLAADDPIVEALLARRGSAATCVPGEDALRRIRLAKSATELKMMRIAAQNNVDAALATIAAVRTVGTTGELRTRFFAETTRRGNQPVFIVIDGSSSEIANDPIRDGMAFSIDCVSHCLHYHGDFARTIFVGEPHPLMRRGTTAIYTAWREIQTQLRAGMRFADVQRIGRESMKKQAPTSPSTSRRTAWACSTPTIRNRASPRGARSRGWCSRRTWSSASTARSSTPAWAAPATSRT